MLSFCVLFGGSLILLCTYFTSIYYIVVSHKKIKKNKKQKIKTIKSPCLTWFKRFSNCWFIDLVYRTRTMIWYILYNSLPRYDDNSSKTCAHWQSSANSSKVWSAVWIFEYVCTFVALWVNTTDIYSLPAHWCLDLHPLCWSFCAVDSLQMKVFFLFFTCQGLFEAFNIIRLLIRGFFFPTSSFV